MGKECQSGVKEGIGCESVQKMMREIDELKKAKAHWGFFITFTVLFVLFAGMLIYNTWPQKVKDRIISINVVEAKEKTTGDEVHISKNALEDTLQKSAYAARREAQIEYDRNFSTLLTILTIFGIAWPLIIAFVQYKFNEKEMKEARTAISETKQAQRDLKLFEDQYIKSAFMNWANFRTVFELLSMDVQNKHSANLCHACSLNCLVSMLQLKRSEKLSRKDFSDLLAAIDKVDPKLFNATSRDSSKTILLSIKTKLVGIMTSDDELNDMKKQGIEQLEQKIDALNNP